MRMWKRALLAILLPAIGLLALVPMPRTEADPKPPNERIVLYVHGGEGGLPAGTPADVEKAHRDGLARALRAGYDALHRDGGTSLDAVEMALRVLEDDPHFNAGKGAAFTHEGRNELDASIMEGRTRRAGAVASVCIIKNPISAARRVMEKSPHVLLVGRGAELFATRQGLDIVDPSYFWTLKRWNDLKEALDRESSGGKKDPQQEPARPGLKHRGTVGAVAVDEQGNLAAGTSTGGLTNKWAGRVGDSPIIGAGTYADNESCAVSCTGVGEYFIRYAAAHDISALVKYKGLSVQQAAEEVVNGKLKKAGGEGGVIVLDAHGTGTAVFNGSQMSRGYITRDGTVHVTILEHGR